MGLFNKVKEKRSDERNEIENEQLKEALFDKALQMLVEGKDYVKLDYTTCEFGYVYIIENYGVEALFKIRTDVNVFYFAAQENTIKRLNINEELFNDITETFLNIH